jgi:hypothetical protein
VFNFAHCLTVRVELQIFRIYSKHPSPIDENLYVRQDVRKTVIDTISSRYPGAHHRFLSVIADQVPILTFWDLIFMNSSLRSATLFFSGSFSRFFSRLRGLGRIVPVLLFSGFLFLPLTAEAGLPRTAVSIPTDQNLAAGLNAAEQCDVANKLLVLPPLAFNFAGDQSPASLFDEQAQAVQSVPEGSEIWLHVVVDAGSLAGKESEKQITERVGAFVKSMPLSAPAVRGVIIEIKGTLTAPDLFAFGLVRLALNAKGSNAGLRLAFVFEPGFVSRHGDIVKRLATYSDLLGTTYYEGWRQDAAWIAEHALNKPLILKLDAAASSATSPLLTAMVAASGTSVEIVWSEPPDAKAAATVCTVNSLMTRSITNNMFPSDSAASPFSITVDGVGNDQHRWFGAGSDAVIVARVNGSPGHSKTVRLQGLKPGPFEIKWYDPESGAQLPAGAATKTDKGFAQTCDCTSEYALISIHTQSEADQTLYNTVEVKGGVDLKIEEIIARWQQNREAQKQRLANYMASSFMSLHFESTNLGPGFDVSMQLEQFFTRDGQMEVAQKEFYVNGVKFGKNHEFPLPQIEP